YLAGAVKAQQEAISDQSAAIDEQGSKIDELNLKISGSASGTSSLQTAINDKLTIVSNSLTAMNSSLAVNTADVADVKTRLAAAETKLQTDEDNLTNFEVSTTDTLQSMLETENMLTEKVLNHEDRIAALEAKMTAMTITAGGTIPDNVLMEDQNGGLTLTGIFEAEEVVAGAYSVKNDDLAKKTVGDDSILAGNIQQAVLTKAVNESSKIFVTFESDPGARYWTEKTTDEVTGVFTGFTVKLSDPAQADVKFSWWIVEEK
ncbi:MAG TPA: hypothetical protein VK254_03210, partial [Candidatus Bathyarchaeia archaeon]|nr:hypothetical protein [Candidatus Bathyarchaeia archaeon]